MGPPFGLAKVIISLRIHFWGIILDHKQQNQQVRDLSGPLKSINQCKGQNQICHPPLHTECVHSPVTMPDKVVLHVEVTSDGVERAIRLLGDDSTSSSSDDFDT